MLNTIKMFLYSTPTWVYLLFFYLVWVGIKSSKDGVVSLKKLFIIPCIFLYMSLHYLVVVLDFSYLVVSSYVISLLLGIYFGYLLIIKKHIQVDKKKLLLNIPGSWSTLIIIMIIFFSKYYFHYKISVDNTILQSTLFKEIFITSSGILTGLLIGKAVGYWRKLKMEKHVDLTLK